MAASRAVASFSPSSLNLHFLKHSIIPILIQEFNYTNIREVPTLEKIVVKYGSEEVAENAKDRELSAHDLSLITGQRPGMPPPSETSRYRDQVEPLGLFVTLRRQVMHSFLERLINLGLPRMLDFQGAHTSSFDGKGNYRISFRDQNVFGELRDHYIGRPRALNVHITTTAQTNKEAQRLLALMGMPFQEGETGEAKKISKKKKLRSHHFDSKAKIKARR